MHCGISVIYLLRTHDDFNSSDPRDQVIGYQKIHMACFLTRGAIKVILSHIEGPRAWSVTSSSANVGDGSEKFVEWWTFRIRSRVTHVLLNHLGPVRCQDHLVYL